MLEMFKMSCIMYNSSKILKICSNIYKSHNYNLNEYSHVNWKQYHEKPLEFG